ncbi:MAG TPA: HD domain-containing protein [Lacipirellulaceae bacterium]
MAAINDIPEIAQWRTGGSLVRIPPGIDVPLTDRVRRLIDTAAFRRLAQVSQLGLVSLVYPAANHTRQEHSLGVYQAAIEFLVRLSSDERFASVIRPPDAELLLASALLHDIGHWPFGHPIEDLGLAQVPDHEMLARKYLLESEIATALREDWNIAASDVAALIAGETHDPKTRILRSLLSGPIDVDKVDYLMRDSLHAGVPYGRHFDRQRLLGSLCLNQAGDGLAITDKGKTAAEMMVFARYVMFSEVYWHHAVRAATAMLQRAVFLLRDALDFDELVMLTERPLVERLQATAIGNNGATELLDGLFGARRRLYKRLAQYSYFEEPELYERLARQPYQRLVCCAEALAAIVSQELSATVAPHEILLDAPPAELEVEFNVDVYFPKRGVFRRLGDISPVVRTLAREQFDDYVKRVRVFVHPRIAPQLRQLPQLHTLINEAVQRVT